MLVWPTQISTVGHINQRMSVIYVMKVTLWMEVHVERQMCCVGSLEMMVVVWVVLTAMPCVVVYVCC